MKAAIVTGLITGIFGVISVLSVMDEKTQS